MEERTRHQPVPSHAGPDVGAAGLRALRLLVEGGPSSTGGWWASVVDSGLGSPGSPTGRGGGLREEPDQPDLERVRALVVLAQSGDAEAFAVLYDRCVGTVYRYVLYRVGSHHVAEDLTSETFVRALRRIDTFTWTGRDIAAWFITIARNLVMDHVKSSRYKLEITTGELLDGDERATSTENEVLDRLRDQRLLEAMRELKPEQQECVVLRFLQGLSLAETAEVMGRSSGAVKQLQLRAVRALHRELGGERP